MSSAGCGETSEFDGLEIVGVEGAFTGVALNPETDPTGLGMLLALIDGRYWPIQVCGDSGIGVPFNDEDAKAGNVPTTTESIDSSGSYITAHACLLDCNYLITTELGAEVIVAFIDGKWNIIRVRHTAFTAPLTGPTSECRCCGFNPSRVKLMARVIAVEDSSCGGYPACTEWELDPAAYQCDNPSLTNPLNIQVNCYSVAGSELEDINDWEVRICDQTATNISLRCSIVDSDCDNRIAIDQGIGEYCGCGDTSSTVSSETSSSTELTRFELTVDTGVLATCGGCRYTILIYTVPVEDDPCADDDVIVDEVYAEACGLTNLNVGDRVIIAEVPYTGDHDPSGTCGPIEYFIIRACTIDDCSDPCEPPIPPGGCCGITCNDLPATVTATIEISDCDCSCSFSVTLPKSECLEGNEYGEWRDEYTSLVRCDSLRNYFELASMQYRCGDAESSSSASSSGPLLGGSLLFNGVGGTLVESSCDPIYSVFELVNPPICKEKFPGMVPPIPDLSCRVRVTITE